MNAQAYAHATQSDAAPLVGFVSGTPKTILRAEGLAVLALAAFGFERTGGSWALFAVLFLAPDLSMFGYLAGPRLGAGAYNAAHSYLGPAALGVVGVALSGQPALELALIWAAHVGFDRTLGYGLKYPTSFGDTHLGRIGKARRAPAPNTGA